MRRPALAQLLALALGLALPQAHASPTPAPPTLRVGGFIVAPLMLGEPTEPLRGALPDFIKREIAPQTQIRFVWLPAMSFSRAMKSLRDGTMDILLMYGGSSGSSQGIGRFDWVYLQTSAHLAVNAASELREVKSLDALAGLQIGWVSGSKLPAELLPVAIRWQLAPGQNWQLINLRKLKAGRIDAAYYANPYSPAYLARKENQAIRLLPLPMPTRPLGMAYSLQTDKALIAEFDGLATKAFKGERFRQFVEGYSD